MTENIWTFISAVLSVAFGWFLNEVSQHLKGRKEDKKIKKKVLFYLLELYYTLKQLDTQPVIGFVSHKISERLPKEEQHENYKALISGFYQQIIENLRERETSDKLKELESKYKNALDDLASVDPISSYQLLGDTDFFKVIDALSYYLDVLKTEFPNDTKDIDEVEKKIIEFLKPEALTEILENLESKVKKISSSIGIFTRFRAIKAIKKQNNPIDENKFPTLTKYLDNFIPKQ